MIQLTPQQQWHYLKHQGTPTIANIDAIASQLPLGKMIPPYWYIEMMAVRQRILKQEKQL